MSERARPGMGAVTRRLNPEMRTTADACYRIAVELRAEINSLRSALEGAVTARPGKREVARREARIEGMKWALALAMGFPMSGWQEAVEALLEDFRQERLAYSRSRRLTNEGDYGGACICTTASTVGHPDPACPKG